GQEPVWGVAEERLGVGLARELGAPVLRNDALGGHAEPQLERFEQLSARGDARPAGEAPGLEHGAPGGQAVPHIDPLEPLEQLGERETGRENEYRLAFALARREPGRAGGWCGPPRPA